LGHKLQHRIIAEGVETADQFDVLNNLGCDTAQGFLFSKPVGADEIRKILNSNIENGRSMWS
ncbi:MAG: EAL domain-containing protein, partial [Candidatus Thiodiazotropha endolucinida]